MVAVFSQVNFFKDNWEAFFVKKNGNNAVRTK